MRARRRALVELACSLSSDVGLPMLLRFSGFELDDHLRELRRDGQQVPIQKKEMDLLLYLIRFRGRVVPREELLANVWQISPKGVTTRTIDMHIARLREKLKDDSANPQIILTVRGKGYMFGAREEEAAG